MAEEANNEEEIVIPSKEELLGGTIEEEQADESHASDEEREFTETEQEAIAQGWNPDGVEGKPNLSAEEFLGRKPLYDDLHKQKRKIKELEKRIEEIGKHQIKARQEQREQLLAELKAQKKLAYQEEDFDRVDELDDQIADEKAKIKEEAQVEQQVVNEAFQEWIPDNKWYETNSEMRDEADVYGKAWWAKHPDEPLESVYEAVTEYIKIRYPENFKTAVKPSAPAVEGTRRTPSKRGAAKKLTANDMPDSDRAIMRTVLKSSDITEQEYVDQYFGQ